MQRFSLSLKQYCCSIVLAFVLFGLSFLMSYVRDQAFGQSLGSIPAPTAHQATGLPDGVPQVIVRQQAEPPKTVVDFSLIEQGGRKINVVTTVDTETKRITVHHVDTLQGTIKWLGTRNIQQDLLVDEFNAVKPTPREMGESLKHLVR